jgi:hypothetical protein
MQKLLEKAKELTSCYPRALSFATLKSGAQDKMISEFRCIMTRLPLFQVIHQGDGKNAWIARTNQE